MGVEGSTEFSQRLVPLREDHGIRHRRASGEDCARRLDVRDEPPKGGVVLLRPGPQIVEAGERDVIFNSENPFVRQFLAGASAGLLTMD